MSTIKYHSDALADDFALFCDDVRRIGAWQDLFAHGPPISALTVSPAERSLQSVVQASREILLARPSGLASSRLWVFLADGPWQDDTRLAQYWRLWRYLGREGVVWPKSQRGPEIAARLPNRVRFATAGLVDGVNLDAAMTVAFRALCTSFMLVSTDDFLNEPGVLGLFEAAFSRPGDDGPDTHVNWGRLIHVRAMRGDVIVKRAGLFDEPAWSIDLFARPDVLLQFLEYNHRNQG